MANKNSLRKKAAAHDAFGRIKHGRGSAADVVLAGTVGTKPPLDAYPKVARKTAGVTNRGRA